MRELPVELDLRARAVFRYQSIARPDAVYAWTGKSSNWYDGTRLVKLWQAATGRRVEILLQQINSYRRE